MTNIAMEAMAHLVRWFTVFKSGRSFHGDLLNNQMVKKMCSTVIRWVSKHMGTTQRRMGRLVYNYLYIYIYIIIHPFPLLLNGPPQIISTWKSF